MPDDRGGCGSPSPPSNQIVAYGRGKRVFYANPEIARQIPDLAAAEKHLDGTEIAGRPVDDRRLGSLERVGALFAPHQANPGSSGRRVCVHEKREKVPQTLVHDHQIERPILPAAAIAFSGSRNHPLIAGDGRIADIPLSSKSGELAVPQDYNPAPQPQHLVRVSSQHHLPVHAKGPDFAPSSVRLLIRSCFSRAVAAGSLRASIPRISGARCSPGSPLPRKI